MPEVSFGRGWAEAAHGPMGGRCIIDILLDTQVDEGYEATQVDSTQEDGLGHLGL